MKCKEDNTMEGDEFLKINFSANNIEYKVVGFNKIYQDISFEIPFTICLKIRIDSNNFIRFVADNKWISKNDTVVAKMDMKYPKDVSDNLFLLKSINGIRNESMEKNIKSLPWWSLSSKEEDKIYSLPMKFENNKSNFVDYRVPFNGRTTCLFDNGYLYILFDVWG